jgi:hypothetical protein
MKLKKEFLVEECQRQRIRHAEKKELEKHEWYLPYMDDMTLDFNTHYFCTILNL